ncbi:RidA family protein [Actinoallomurus spadix]|uniref:RidA family protein n=1 Tax=Actinoallomurus spadix TaxID=79912 RepID=A0ABN0WAV6_9ACTN|nr:RidA family protein [Actinoallomurus spadix]MCO5988571.1 RidA family protein [Actinoallomurus spadix]
MTPEALDGPEFPPALGPYSPAVKAGPLVFVSAQAGVDPVTDQVPPGEFEAECRQAFTNVTRALRAADSDLCRVVKMTILYVDTADLPIINKVYAEAFPIDPPARTAAVVRLAGGRRIAVDAIAMALS